MAARFSLPRLGVRLGERNDVDENGSPIGVRDGSVPLENGLLRDFRDRRVDIGSSETAEESQDEWH